MSSQQFCTFFLDGMYFGIPVEDVQEVIRHQDMTAVPLSKAAVGGLINLRGQIVVAIELRNRLALQEREPGRLPMNVVLRTEDGPVSLLVDEIGDVVDTDDECSEPAPEMLRGDAREMVRFVYKLQGRLLMALDTERVLCSKWF